MNHRLGRRVGVALVVASILSSILVSIPAGASPQSAPSLATVTAALDASGANVGYAANWGSSNSSPVVASNNGLTVSLPERATDQVVLSNGRTSMAVGIPYAVGDSPAQNIGNATTVFTGGAPDVAVAAQADTNGAREAITITGPNAPTTYTFPVALPAGASLVANPDGSYSIIQRPTTGVVVLLGTVAAPWAKDANGNSVPTTYTLQGNTLVQSVGFTDTTAFPVVADPLFTFGFSVYLNLTGYYLTIVRSAVIAVVGVGASITVGALCGYIEVESLGLAGTVLAGICSWALGGLGSVFSIGSAFSVNQNLNWSTCYQYNVFSLPWTKVVVDSSNCSGEATY